jgi:TyrR family helix-turn-helix protein
MMVTIKQVMTRDYPSLSCDARIQDAVNHCLEKGLQSVPVVNSQNVLVGVVSYQSFLMTLKNGIDPNSPVNEIMFTDFQTIQENEPIESLIYNTDDIILATNKAGCLTGVITKSDLAGILGEKYFTHNPYLKAIFDSLQNDGILVIDKNAKLLYCNAFAEKIMRISFSETIGRRIQEIFNDDLLLRVLQTGQPEEGGKKEVDGLIMTSRGFPILKNGVVFGAFGVFQDISDKENLKKELARIEALNKELNGIIDSSYDGLVITDAQGKLLRISRSYSRISRVNWDKLQHCVGYYVGDLEKSKKSYKYGSSPDESLLNLKNNQLTIIKKRLWNSIDLTFTGNPILNDDGTIDRVVWNIRDETAINELKREIEENEDKAARYFTELEELRTRLLITETEGVVIHSLAMRKVVDAVARVSTVDATVLITGETGVGKEIIAKVIHKSGSRRRGPLILINCGAIPESLIESELFGYESGAFTGATRGGKIGLLEAANNGTVFLDEIGDLPMSLQVKLLRFIQDQQIGRIGGTKQITLDVRILAATNKDLKLMVKENKFREDLFYRLSVVPIHIPPLRERREDIIPLAQSFLKKYTGKYKIEKKISQGAFDIMEQYSWPGNVRELKNLIEHALIISDGALILPRHIQNYLENNRETQAKPIKIHELSSLKDAKESVEREILNEAMNSGLSTRKIADRLQVDHSTIVRKLSKYKIGTIVPSPKPHGNRFN